MEKFTELHKARISLARREAGLRDMQYRHARERMQKEQAATAARARVRLLEQEAQVSE